MVPAARFMAENDSSWRLSHKLNRHKASGIRGKILYNLKIYRRIDRDGGRNNAEAAGERCGRID
jgi:hypothetical protein